MISLLGALLLFLRLPIRLCCYAVLSPGKEQYLSRLRLADESLLIIALPMVWTTLLFFMQWVDFFYEPLFVAVELKASLVD